MAKRIEPFKLSFLSTLVLTLIQSSARVVASMFACLVAGELVQTECVQVSETQFAFSIEKATTIRNLAVFMTGSEPFPDGLGAIVHFSWPPYNNWQVLGHLTNAKPSAIFAVRQSHQIAPESSGANFSYQSEWQTPQQQQV